MGAARAAAGPAGRAAPLTLGSSLAWLRGAGPQAAASLRNLGLETVGDLLFHLPQRYEDRRRPKPLGALQAGEEALVRGIVADTDTRFAPRRMLRVVIVDPDGAQLLLRFFHFGDAQRQSLQRGRWVQAYGTARQTPGGMEMVHPDYRVADDRDGFEVAEGLTPVYGLTAGITQRRLRRFIAQALEIAARDVHLNAQLPGLPPPQTLAALGQIHRPEGEQALAALLRGEHEAQRRLVREELLAHQLCMRLLRRLLRGRPAPRLAAVIDAAAELEAGLPFSFTGAQRRAIAELGADLAESRPMLRLLQGDVGSGKTVVAAAAMLAAARAGYQAVLMAPTELLAEQHYANFERWFAPLGLGVALLTGKLKKAQKSEQTAALATGGIALAIGTHALFQSEVAFARLALVVVDEQHRFGVQQRLALRDKGPDGATPHQLIMSATPIPRTLAQTVYADLDVSVIDELPPGRTPVTTVVMSNQRRDEVLRRIGDACRAGRQAYWVCTLIEASDKLQAEAAEQTAERLRGELADLRIGLVHGRLKSEQKEAQMRAFQDGATQLLVATTVIEVGVDVPNASIMVIENAERLGLAQLHQLRGRVGRGSAASQCLLMYQPPLSDPARARLETLRATGDGFRIAQRDLELRGPGEILGRRQTGIVGLKIADPVRDAALVPPLQRLADEYLERFPNDARRLIARWVGDLDKYGQV